MSVYLRLLQMLELGKLSECNDPLLTYGRLEAEASSLQEELVSVHHALERAAQEQGYCSVRLEHDRDTLERSAYSDIVQPLLRPQVCATATPAQELCPNAQVCFTHTFLVLILIAVILRAQRQREMMLIIIHLCVWWRFCTALVGWCVYILGSEVCF